MKKCPSKRIKYLKTLQHLAMKYRAKLSFAYCSGEGYWWGNFRIKDDEELVSRDKNFTQMLQKLHYEVRTVALPVKEKE